MIFANANTVLENNISSINSKDRALLKRSNRSIGKCIALSRQTPNLDLYIEKVTIWEKGVMKDVLLLIYKEELNLIFIDKEI